MELKSNTYISFNVHSNKDLKLNNSFNLKFTVTAHGFEELRNNKIQVKDLCDSITCLFGKHLSRCYMQRFNLSTFVVDKSSLSSSGKHADQLQRSNSSKTENELGDYSASSVLNSASIHVDAKINPFFAYQQPSVLASHMASMSSSSDTKQKIFENYNSEFYRILFRGGLGFSNDKTTSALIDTPESNSNNIFVSTLSFIYMNIRISLY